MPIISLHDTDDFKLVIWEITESTENLFNAIKLSKKEEIDYCTITSDTRKKEWLAVRNLLDLTLHQKDEICYDLNGKPSLKLSHLNISITHAKKMAGILLSAKKHIGLDIEQANRKMEKVIPRFLNKTEQKTLSDLPHWMAIVFWCCKEAVFKAVEQPGVDFSETIHLSPLNTNRENGIIEAHFKNENLNKSLELHYFLINGYYCVYTVT